MPSSSEITQAQQTSLDDTDCYASVWGEILAEQQQQEDAPTNKSGLWGGRGKGGRGLARRTVQPNNVVLDNVRLQYLKGAPFLEGATIKLLHGHVYSLIGKNGCGKSSLLKRMDAQKIPGWSTSWSSIYIPPELPPSLLSKNPVEVILQYYDETNKSASASTEKRLEELSEQIDQLNLDEEQDKMEALCEEMSLLEEQLQSDQSSVEHQAKEALHDFGIRDDDTTRSCEELSRGQRKRVLLTVAWVCSFTNLLLLDEPTDNLDILGLIQLRRLIEMSPATVVLVSHDIDLINDVATDIIDVNMKKLSYYPGNYDSFRLMRNQQEMHDIQQSIKMEKKRDKLKTTLQHLKDKPVPKRGGTKKKAKAVAAQRKKLNKHESLEKSLNTSANVPPPRKGLTATQRLKLAETLKIVPDKEVQFVLPKVNCTWGETLITTLDVGHGYNLDSSSSSSNAAKQVEVVAVGDEKKADEIQIVKKAGFLFDYVALCIEEGSRYCILGETACGKSTLLKILAKGLDPVEGTVYHASGVSIGYFDADVVDDIMASVGASTTALDYLTDKYHQKTEEFLRGHLAAFGLSPTSQAKTPLCFLSGGEKCRFALATVMLENPQVLILDNPTSNLDVQSVQALIYGLKQWNGTLVMVSQDVFFVRSLEDVKCAVL
eukprot:CAMPEP_0113659756 /NCGR_PEP_ID=MMETSP0017_2-20120614/32533_1 /TAXON_ID=2856 /ORGANISM="Cylindrotheca closterium" /LENGTH=657 /DNA_ID=CAMNT_0000574339 /DNA_START=195 /DNA_END=2165 /DNA_ORIENTATION=- /assembly_acc=CAM_ASM_000147